MFKSVKWVYEEKSSLMDYDPVTSYKIEDAWHDVNRGGTIRLTVHDAIDPLALPYDIEVDVNALTEKDTRNSSAPPRNIRRVDLTYQGLRDYLAATFSSFSFSFSFSSHSHPMHFSKATFNYCGIHVCLSLAIPYLAKQFKIPEIWAKPPGGQLFSLLELPTNDAFFAIVSTAFNQSIGTAKTILKVFSRFLEANCYGDNQKETENTELSHI